MRKADEKSCRRARRELKWRALAATSCGVLWLAAGGAFAATIRLPDEAAPQAPPRGAQSPPPAGFAFAGAGFRIEKIAGDPLAYDIQCLTLDARARVVVSGPGYIRTLIDADGDGFLETARETYRGPASGAQGLLADETGLYFVGGRGLERLEDADGDGRADGPPRLVFPIRTGGEHHAHAVRRGHDGFLYLLLGNHAGFTASRLTGRASAVLDPYAGLLVRLAPDASSVEVLAQGMRNSYDFDFGATGAILAWDSDSERDEGLPWYRPCRLYHLTPGADCGWRSSGAGKVPTYALDTIAPVAEVGRGSPTGVAVYRHTSFPQRYQGGVFALDWTFGRILFFPLRENGASLRSDWEVFLDSSPATPFAPTDIEVAPDGSLIVSSGGRGLSGSVYRIAYTGRGSTPAGSAALAVARSLDAVLRAPMPLAAWSRALWVPRAREIPAAEYLAALADASRPASERARALHVLLDLRLADYASVFETGLRSASGAARPLPVEVRLGAAWWAGRARHIGAVDDYLRDPHPHVLRTAVESAMPFLATDGDAALVGRVFDHATHPERRVRQAVAYALSHVRADRLPAPRSSREHLVLGLASVLRSPWGRLPGSAVEAAAAVLEGASTDADVLDGLRLAEIAFERLRGRHEPDAIFYQGSGAVDLAPWGATIERLAPVVRRALGAADPRLSREGARVASLIGLHDDGSLDGVLARIGLSTAPGEDLLTLSFLARFAGPWDGPRLDRLVDAFLGVSWKVRSGRVGRDQRWHRYVGAVAAALFERHAALGSRLLADGRFGDPDHVPLAIAMEREDQRRAATKFAALPLPRAAAERRSVVGFLARYPDISRTVLRGACDEPALRTVALSGLAREPLPEDYDRFLEALGAGDRNIVPAAVDGILGLPPPAAGTRAFVETAAGLLRWGIVLDADPTQRATRDRIATALGRLTREDDGDRAGAKQPERATFEAWTRVLAERYPQVAAAAEGILSEARSAESRLAEVLERAPWSDGDAAAGARVFEKYACNTCHHLGGKGVRVGPDLAGIARRFSLEEIVTAIGAPNRQVAPRYRSEVLVLESGERLEGLPIYDSRAAMLFQVRDGRFLRVRAEEIAARLPQAQSLMPTGYLESMSLEEIAALVAFLRER